jgi:serine/threonine protein kinase
MDIGAWVGFRCNFLQSVDKLGEPTYVAPEIQKFIPSLKLNDEETTGVEVIAPAADVWALGLILLEMITGIELPREKSLRDSLQVLDEPVTWEWLEKNFGQIHFPASTEIKHLLSRMLDPNPVNRIGIQEALKLDIFSTLVLPLDLSKVDVSMDEKMEHSSLDDLASFGSSSPNSHEEDDEEDEISFLMGKKQKVDNHAQLLREMQRRESFELTTGEISLAQDLEDRMNLRPKALFNVNG